MARLMSSSEQSPPMGDFVNGGGLKDVSEVEELPAVGAETRGVLKEPVPVPLNSSDSIPFDRLAITGEKDHRHG